MNTKIVAFISFLLNCLLISHGLAQSTYQGGLLPGINCNVSLPENYSLNVKAASRQAFFEGDFSGDSGWKSQYILTDVSIIAARKIGLNNRLAGGYEVRFRDLQIIHRLVQQITIISRLPGLRIGQRLAMDQSFIQEEELEYRFRYRITSDFPLNGESVDPSEMYVKLSNEYLHTFQGIEYDMEIRIVPLLGYLFQDNNKLEVGLDYRLGNIFSESDKNSFWMKISWYISL